MTAINSLTCPAGTSGLAVEPWSRGEIYAVSANGSQASSPILTYGPNGWSGNGRQVADYRHNPAAALRSEIVEAIATSEGIPTDEVDDDEVDGIVDDATDISDE